MNIKSLFKYTLIVLSIFAYSSTLNAKGYKVKGTVFDADGEKVGRTTVLLLTSDGVESQRTESSKSDGYGRWLRSNLKKSFLVTMF